MNSAARALKRDLIINYEKEVNDLSQQQAEDLVDMMTEEQFEYAYQYAVDNQYIYSTKAYKMRH